MKLFLNFDLSSDNFYETQKLQIKLGDIIVQQHTSLSNNNFYFLLIVFAFPQKKSFINTRHLSEIFSKKRTNVKRRKKTKQDQSDAPTERVAGKSRFFAHDAADRPTRQRSNNKRYQCE